MRRHFFVLGLAAVTIGGCASKDKSIAATQPAENLTAANGPAEGGKSVPMPSGRGNDFTLMGQVITFTPEQKEKFEAAVKARNEGYDRWAKSERGVRYQALKTQETAARRAGNEAKLKEISTELTALRAEQEKVRADLRRELNKSLTLEQQRQWASHALFLRATTNLGRSALGEGQKKEAKAITDRIAAERVKEGTAERDPYLLLDEAAVKQASAEIEKITKRV
jgi:hypothetical protein